MKTHSAAVFFLAAFLFLAEDALAHKVSVFAFVDADAVQVECRFSRSQKVKNGTLTFIDAETNEPIGEGMTDDQGICRFRPPEAFLQTGHSLKIRLHAGEGHGDEWTVPPEELKTLSPNAQSIPDEQNALSPVDSARLEAMIRKILQERDADPTLRDIVGGIGWILGLLGLATYMKYKR